MTAKEQHMVRHKTTARVSPVLGALIIAVGMIISLASSTGPVEPTPDLTWAAKIRPTHPRLYFTAETWPTIRERALTVCAEDYARVRKIAETREGDDWLKIKRPPPLAGSGLEVY